MTAAPASTTASIDAAFAELLGHETRHGGDRAAVFHQLAEHRAEQKQRKELRQKRRGAAHEGLRPVGEQRLAAKGGGNERRGWRQHQHAPAAEREPDEKQQADKDAEQSHLKDSIDRYQSLPSFRTRLQAANPESITRRRRARPYGDNCEGERDGADRSAEARAEIAGGTSAAWKARKRSMAPIKCCFKAETMLD